MAMNEMVTWVLAWMAGGALGAFFFGGLWWTVRKGVSSARPALWFLGSMLLRICVALAGFSLVAGANWKRLILCLLGFVMARFLVTWWTRPTGRDGDRTNTEASHAP